ncbi:MAG: hypothetical protein Q7U54_18750 [Bacteroidales bacterium]|nr:hypothetical protein [Bacteroidales bacterium]
MNTYKIFLISVFIVVVSVKTLAQDLGTKTDIKISSVKSVGTSKQNISKPATFFPNQKQQQKSEKSQIYIGNDWALGTIVLRNGGVIDSYFLRYNVLADQLEFIAGKDTLAFKNPEELNTVSFGGHTFVFEMYIIEKVFHRGYFELIVPGKNKLILKRSVTDPVPDSRYQNVKSPAKYHVEKSYFICKPDTPANMVEFNRKSALTYLNEHKEDIAEYLRITENKVRTIEDLKLLVSYYNSLDEEY